MEIAGYCYLCGEPFAFDNGGKIGGYTTPETHRVCHRCFEKRDEARDQYYHLLEGMQAWLEDLRQLVDGWPEEGSMCRFQDLLHGLISRQIAELDENPEDRREVPVSPDYHVEREQALCL